MSPMTSPATSAPGPLTGPVLPGNGPPPHTVPRPKPPDPKSGSELVGVRTRWLLRRRHSASAVRRPVRYWLMPPVTTCLSRKAVLGWSMPARV